MAAIRSERAVNLSGRMCLHTMLMQLFVHNYIARREVRFVYFLHKQVDDGVQTAPNVAVVK